MKISALILAKRNSSRLKDKNILPFNGEPMFLTNVRKCLKIFDSVYVSSDDCQILEQAEEAGAIGIQRDETLCGDTPNIPVYRHAMGVMECDAFVAVQANSPNVKEALIRETKRLLEHGYKEVMTKHYDNSIYGSLWAMTRERLKNYGDPYKPTPTLLIVDQSTDIHTEEDYQRALKLK